jgi:4-amino-4-deoxy-L-arabinose transferase-like glycosyltransferase
LTIGRSLGILVTISIDYSDPRLPGQSMTTTAPQLGAAPRSVQWTARRLVLAWAVILTLFALMRISLISIPFERDEGEYANIAQRMLVGDVPYRDAFDQKPPGVFLIYLITFALFGQSVQAVHVVMHVWTLAGVVLLFKLVQRLSGTTAGLLAAMAYAVMTAERGVLGSTANTEIFMLTPMVAGILCVVPNPGQRVGAWRLMASGALLGIAFWIKQVVITDILFVGILVTLADCTAWKRDAGTLRRVLGRQLLLLLGAIAVTAPIFLYFIWNHALHDFLYCAFIYNFGYSTSELHSVSQIWGRFWGSFCEILISDWLFWLAGLIAIAVMARRRSWRLLSFYIGFALLSFGGVTFAGYFRPHYFMQVLPAVATLAGLGLAWILTRLATLSNPLLRYPGQTAVLIGALAVPVINNRSILFAPSPAVASIRLYGVNRFVFSQAIGERLRDRTSPADPILIAGAEPQIAFYAHRRNATRFIFFDPLSAHYPGVLVNQQQAIAEITGNQPAYIVDVMGIGPGDSAPLPAPSETYFFDALRRYEQSSEYAIDEVWIALAEDKRSQVPQLYLNFTIDQLREVNRQMGTQIPIHAAVYKRVAPRKSSQK